MFGASSNSTAAPFLFGSNASAAPAASSGFGATNSGGLFGQNKPATTTFGSKSAVGATPAQNGQTTGFGATPASGGLFGLKPPASAPSTAFGSQPSTAGFGSSASNTAAPAGGLFGAKPAATTSGGMFGNSNTATQPASGGLFGNTSSTNTTGGGLFGAKPAAAPATTGGLFGAKPAAPASGGLFGSTPAAPAAGTTGGLFGSTNAAPASGGMFGSTANAPASGATSGGLFGAKPAAPASGGLFGGNTSSNGLLGGNSAGGLLGSNTASNGLFGQAAPNQQMQLTAMTRVGDLPAPFKKELEDLDKYISTQHLIATTLHGDLNKHDQLIKSIPTDVNYLYTKVSSIRQALTFDAKSLVNIKQVNDELTEDIRNIMQLILQLLTPGSKFTSSFHLNDFFISRINKYRDLLAQYEGVIAEGAGAISGLERSCNDTVDSIYSVVELVKAQYTLFMELAETLAGLHQEAGQYA